MQSKRIISFLKDIAENNNRPWFHEHRGEYDAIRADFEEGIAKAISRISEFDTSIAHITVKDTVYRFYRDTRFSPDKSPYKRHLGAFICLRGRKSISGGYYIHLEPGNCLLACGNYWMPMNVLTACRNEIMGNIDRWLGIVEDRKFLNFFGKPGDGEWKDEAASPKGFGLSMLSNAPKGFPRDYEHLEYLKMKDYCCWKRVPDTFFDGDGWLDEMAKVFQVAKPMNDFVNAVIADYE